MTNRKIQFFARIKEHSAVIGTFLLIALALLLLWHNHVNSNQAADAIVAQIRFEGEYRIGEGSWQEIRAGHHIPATKGDVLLRGNFHVYLPDGAYIGLYDGNMPLAFYINHINLTFFEASREPYVIDHENPLYGVSVCGIDWTVHTFSASITEPIEILVHNPHQYGNDTAIDEMLSSIGIWDSIVFERTVYNSGQNQRNIGLFFMILSFVLLGSALFSALLHMKNNRIMWLLGAAILSAGAYLVFSAASLPFDSESTSLNTSILLLSVMFYMLFVTGIITYFLQKTKKIGCLITVILGIMDGLCLLLPVLTGIYFYDTQPLWVIIQSAANVVLIFCLIYDGRDADRTSRLSVLGMWLILAAFEADVAATAAGFWSGGFLSKYVFLLLVAAALLMILRYIPENINAAARTKELELQRSRLEAEKSIIEAQLKDSRISIMLSQIQPHFIYNTLGTIERLCLKDPERAFDLVRNFSLYLRGNFSELDSVTPIRFTEELKHVEYYVNIEKVRFPDIHIEYQMEATDFVLPALSVQPLVENAIKHGLMRLESGGTVKIHSYETQAYFCVEVKDDGVGFDTSQPVDEKKHVGIRNIRGRLKAMVNGELILESKPDAGTTAIIMIPKEVSE